MQLIANHYKNPWLLALQEISKSFRTSITKHRNKYNIKNQSFTFDGKNITLFKYIGVFILQILKLRSNYTGAYLLNFSKSSTGTVRRMIYKFCTNRLA